jgi:hypothetical protein
MVNRNQLEHVKANAKKLEALLSEYQQRGKLPFGAEKHLFQLKSPITLTQVEIFEAEHQIRLPEDYRAFLLEIGSSGAGPSYGLLPVLGNYNHLPPLVPLPRAGYLASPSPIIPGGQYAQGWADEKEEWVEKLDLDWHPFQGALEICYHGCADFSLLIISGEGRGRVVEVSELFIPPSFAPYPDFLSWYEAWQDAVLNDQLREWKCSI